MGAKEYRQVVETLEALGMKARSNNRGLIFTGPDGWLIPVAAGISDHNAKHVIHNAQKHYGAATLKDAKKRDAQTVRERQERERERLAAERDRNQSELDAYVAAQEERLGGMTEREWSAVCREVERREKEIRRIERLMVEIPSINAHAGRVRAQHRS